MSKNQTSAGKAQSREHSSTVTQDEAMAHLGVLRPVVKRMLADIEKTIVACKRGELSLEAVQENLHLTAGIMGVSLTDGGALS